MARDYSKRGENNRGTNKSRNGKKRTATTAKKRPNKRKKNTRRKSGTPGWVWMGSGLFIGLTVAAVFYIVTRPVQHSGHNLAGVEMPQPKHNSTAHIDTTDKHKAQHKPAQNKSTQPDKPEFSFYKMLPDYKVVIPGQTSKPATTAKKPSSSHTAKASSNKTPPASTSTSTSTSHTSQSTTAKQYVIQVGAFSNSKDANQLKAKVALLGLKAEVVSSKTAAGDPIYRVRSSAISSNDRLTEMLKRLHDHDIDTMVLTHTSSK